MKTIKCEYVYLSDYRTDAGVIARSRFIGEIYKSRLYCRDSRRATGIHPVSVDAMYASSYRLSWRLYR